MLTEAGLPSPPPLRMALGERAARRSSSKPARLAAADGLRGQPAVVVADLIGVSVGTVRSYWRAGRCPRCGGAKVTEHASVCGCCVTRVTRRRLSPGDSPRRDPGLGA